MRWILPLPLYKRYISQLSPEKQNQEDWPKLEEIYDRNWLTTLWRPRSPTISQLQVREIGKPVVWVSLNPESERIRKTNRVTNSHSEAESQETRGHRGQGDGGMAGWGGGGWQHWHTSWGLTGPRTWSSNVQQHKTDIPIQEKTEFTLPLPVHSIPAPNRLDNACSHW